MLDDGDNFRVLPVIGKGGGQNIRDVRFLKGVDLGITQSILLNLYRRSNEIGPIDDKIVYIAKLFNEEMHLVVRADSGIAIDRSSSPARRSISATSAAARSSPRATSSSASAIKAEEVNMGQADAFEKLKSRRDRRDRR